MKGALMAVLVLSIRAYAKSDKISQKEAQKRVLEIGSDGDTE
jgi:hypothetical protein